MFRIPVTDVDAWRYWRSQPDATLDDLRARLMRTEAPSESLALGRAFHAAIEHAKDGDVIEVIEADGMRLRVECEVSLPVHGVREAAVARVVWVPCLNAFVTLSGRVDATDGYEIDDYKTTGRFDPEYLHDLMQWRFYLWMTGTKRHVWHVFEMLDPLRSEPDVYRIVRHQVLAQVAYPGMDDDCRNALDEFLAAVAVSLPEYLESRRKPAEGAVA